MLLSLQRGVITPPDDIIGFLKELKSKKKIFRPLHHLRQLHRLKKKPHDIIVDISSKTTTCLLVFMYYKDVPTVLYVENYFTTKKPTSVIKLDLGPGISPSVFHGSVLEVKDIDNTFHIYDVLYWKGAPTDKREACFKEVGKEVIPFTSTPLIYSYDNIPSLADKRILFYPQASADQVVWVFDTKTNNL